MEITRTMITESNKQPNMTLKEKILEDKLGDFYYVIGKYRKNVFEAMDEYLKSQMPNNEDIDNMFFDKEIQSHKNRIEGAKHLRDVIIENCAVVEKV